MNLIIYKKFIISERNKLLKKFLLLCLVLVTLFSFLTLNVSTAATYKYNEEKAVKYAKKHYKEYNQSINKHGNDCTNFVSQCLNAGGIGMVKPKEISNGISATNKHWYSVEYSYVKKGHKYTGFKESSTWVRVSGSNSFFTYWKSRVGIYVSNDIEKIRKNAKVGDVLQVDSPKDSDEIKDHSMFVGEKNKDDIILYYHTKNTKKSLKNFDKDWRDNNEKGTYNFTLFKFAKR